MDETLFHITIICRLPQAVEVLKQISELMEHYEFEPGNGYDLLKVSTTFPKTENEDNYDNEEEIMSSDVRPFGAAD